MGLQIVKMGFLPNRERINTEKGKHKIDKNNKVTAEISCVIDILFPIF